MNDRQCGDVGLLFALTLATWTMSCRCAVGDGPVARFGALVLGLAALLFASMTLRRAWR